MFKSIAQKVQNRGIKYIQEVIVYFTLTVTTDGTLGKNGPKNGEDGHCYFTLNMYLTILRGHSTAWTSKASEESENEVCLK